MRPRSPLGAARWMAMSSRARSFGSPIAPTAHEAASSIAATQTALERSRQRCFPAHSIASNVYSGRIRVEREFLAVRERDRFHTVRCHERDLAASSPRSVIASGDIFNHDLG